MFGIGVGLTGVSSLALPVGWSMLDLGPSLYDLWDAERAADISLSGSAVTAWRSAKNGYSAAQAVGSARPLYSATGFNGRPGITFDGADDELTYAGVGVFPTGTTPCEIWVLGDQTALPADTTTRIPFSYGTNSNSMTRVTRSVYSGVNRAYAQIGDGTGVFTSVHPTGDLSGRHVIRSVSTGTSVRCDIDGVAGPVVAGVPAVGNTRTRIGGFAGSVAQTFFQGGLSLIAVTAPLSDPEAAKMLAYLKARGGIA